jgi:hypothetical protein
MLATKQLAMKLWTYIANRAEADAESEVAR